MSTETEGTMEASSRRRAGRPPRAGTKVPNPTPFQRFVGYIRLDPSGCHIWTGAPTAQGYGAFKFAGCRETTAHRAAFHFAGIPLPNDAVIAHSCDNRLCVNIAHLIPGTYQDNNSDMARKDRGSRGSLPFGVKRDGPRFKARVKFHGKEKSLGSFATLEEAASAARKYKNSLYGISEE